MLMNLQRNLQESNDKHAKDIKTEIGGLKTKIDKSNADMAEKIVIFLKRLANSQRNIIVTIHQPSSDVFSLFDRLVC